MSVDIFELQRTLQESEVQHEQRRKALVRAVQDQYGDNAGPIVLFAPSDQETRVFEQDSYFFYFSGIIEPATAMLLHNDHQLFYMPQYNDLRKKWVSSQVDITEDTVRSLGFDGLKYTGDVYKGIHVYPYFENSVYSHIIDLLKSCIDRKEKIFTIYPTNSSSAIGVRQVVDRLAHFIPNLHDVLVDISPLANTLRRKKDMAEVEFLYHANAITGAAHQAACHVLRPGGAEAEVQAALEYIFTENVSTSAYPSIVAGGKRAAILHYTNNDQDLKGGELLLVDAGARYNYYCADITRVYPISGTFSDEQKELYNIVLQTQQHVVEHIKPGMWLMNKQEPDRSLHHIAYAFLQKHGYADYFNHGIGHFLGLDVHDVGDMAEPLAEGDVITIEPGIYISDKNVGIRIEDNYWVVEQGEPICLSQDIPKEIDQVEEMVQQSFDVDLS